jgi:tRNA(fMet)-specific endonuclease VapC
MYLLDTTHCIKILSGVLKQKLESLDDTLLSTCVTVVGELLYGAYKSDRVKDNLEAITELLNDMYVVYEIDIETAEIYGQLKAGIIDRFGPKDKSQRRIATTDKLGFKENDLWIAAIAKQHDLIVVSADSDFQRLRLVEDMKIESW